MSPGAIKAARVVREPGTPELVQAVERGLVAVSAAKTLVRPSPKEQGAIALESDKRQRAMLIKRRKRKAAQMPKPTPTPPAEALQLTPQRAKSAEPHGPYSAAAPRREPAGDDRRQDRRSPEGADEDCRQPNWSISGRGGEALERRRLSRESDPIESQIPGAGAKAFDAVCQRWSENFARTWAWPAQGRVPAPPRPNPAPRAP